MQRIAIVTPARAGTRTGNRHTAQRWAAMLRGPGRRVRVMTEWDGAPADVLIALHARRSHDSIARYRAALPRGALVVALTGTDLYRDLPGSREARQSLEIASRLVVLQAEALRELAARHRRKASVVFQSSDADLRHAPPRDRFRVAVVGHLREEKDPFRTAAALLHLPRRDELEVVQLGDAMSPAMAAQAKRWMRREPRYRWIGGVPHAAALGWIARSHLLVVSSVMEGGANVICEAARIGTPVIASRVSGNLGMLGRRHPGYYRLGDERALARLLARAQDDPRFYGRLKSALRERRARFAPGAEKRALLSVLRKVPQQE